MITITDVKSLVSSRYDINILALNTKGRFQAHIKPRFLAMALSRRIGCSYPLIGRRFDRDHTTVINACKVAESKYKKELSELMEELHKNINNRPINEDDLGIIEERKKNAKRLGLKLNKYLQGKESV